MSCDNMRSGGAILRLIYIGHDLMACRSMQTSVADVWAAGDICAIRPEEQEPCWFQMRLWTQVLSILATLLRVALESLLLVCRLLKLSMRV